MKLVLAGPPRSGKSCLREGLKKALCSKGLYPFVLTACPDGEGAWFQDAVGKDAQNAAALKAAYKGKFTADFVRRMADSVTRISLPVVLVDVGGIPSEENKVICAAATHILILSSDPDQFQVWREFAAGLGLEIFAEISSDYHGTADVVQSTEGVVTGSVHHLERGEPNQDRPMIQCVADAIIRHAKS